MDYLLALFLLGLFMFCMVGSTLSDLTTLKIPNLYILLLFVGFVFFAPLSGMGIIEFFQYHLLISVICFAVGFGLFAIGWMGAGDVKLISVTTLWFGYPLSLDYLLLSSILGGVFAVSLLLLRQIALPISLMRIGWIDKLHDKQTGLPYGVALGPTALYIFPYSPWITQILYY